MPTLTPASADSLTLAPVVDGGGYAGFYPSSSTYPSSLLYPGIEETGTASLALGTFSSGTVSDGVFSSMYVVEVLADRPVGYWRMEQPSGVFVDYSGNGHTLSVSGTGIAYQQVGAHDYAAVFSGSAGSDYAYVPYDPAFDLGVTFTLECWIKPQTVGGVKTIIDKGTGAYQLTYLASRAFRLQVSNGGFLANSPSHPIPDDGAYHHIVGQSNGFTSAIWLDGVNITTGIFASTPVDNSNRLSIAAVSSPPTDFLPAGLDEIAIYSTYLSEDRITAHYLAGPTFAAVSTGTLTLTPA